MQWPQSMRAGRQAWLRILTPLHMLYFLKITHWGNFLISKTGWVGGCVGKWEDIDKVQCLGWSYETPQSPLSSNWWFHGLCTKCTPLTLLSLKPVTSHREFYLMWNWGQLSPAGFWLPVSTPLFKSSTRVGTLGWAPWGPQTICIFSHFCMFRAFWRIQVEGKVRDKQDLEVEDNKLTRFSPLRGICSCCKRRKQLRRQLLLSPGNKVFYFRVKKRQLRFPS